MGTGVALKFKVLGTELSCEEWDNLCEQIEKAMRQVYPMLGEEYNELFGDLAELHSEIFLAGIFH